MLRNTIYSCIYSFTIPQIFYVWLLLGAKVKSTVNNPNDSLPYHLRGAFRGFETALARYLETFALPLSHFYILRLQWEAEGHTQRSIAQKAFMTESVASQVIKQMEAATLLRRTSDSKDKRKRLVFLTQAGLDLREKIVRYGIETSSKHSPDISRSELQTTMSVLKRIHEAFETYNNDYMRGRN